MASCHGNEPTHIALAVALVTKIESDSLASSPFRDEEHIEAGRVKQKSTCHDRMLSDATTSVEQE